ncbi:ATP-binding SpoIIE family protein phosphatase [Streptomyces sp. NPDC026665]|uniref:ATP-binding SpoIIE family protein phosphatase n=1 Tax=Streptomyces sp. NPDC026665 TaxID=3154798 RepID=UPI0033F09AED
MDSAEPTVHASLGGRTGVVERDEVLVSAVRQSLCELNASSVTTYLYASGTSTLEAAVVAVAPMGVASLDTLPADDSAYASAVAFRTGAVTTRRSIDFLGEHPDLAVSVAFPFTCAAVPLYSPPLRFGAIAASWPEVSHVLTTDEQASLRRTAHTVASKLKECVAYGVSVEPSTVPVVVPGPPEGRTAGDVHISAPLTAPLMYHLHKLALLLTAAQRTSDAAVLVLERALPVFHAQAIAISLIDADRLRVVGASGCSREFLRTLNGLPLTAPVPETEAIAGMRRIVCRPEQTRGRMLEGNAAMTAAVDDDGSWTVLPLIASGKPVGACSLGFASSDDVALAEHGVLTALATLLGQTFERTQLHDAQHALADKLQQALLPRLLLQPPGVVATSRYVPTAGGIDLGGDWYDLISLPDHGVAAVVGDVQGHNTTAAVVMGQVRSAVRAYATEGHDPVTVLSRTNRLMLDLDTGLFATCCCVWLDPSTGTATIATAGNPAPYLHAPDGSQPLGPIDIGVPLGIETDPEYQATEVLLQPGTLLALYTDGLDSTGKGAPQALEEAFRASESELELLGDRIVGQGDGHRGYSDDVALLLLRYEGSAHEARPNIHHFDIQRRDLLGVQRTRAYLRTWLHSWRLEEMTDTAELLASEVVTNALVHGDSDVSVDVRKYPDHLRVEVRDSDPRQARPVTLPRAEDQAEGGRGLVIVSALASSWGNSPNGRGKTVWFTLPMAESEGLPE